MNIISIKGIRTLLIFLFLSLLIPSMVISEPIYLPEDADGWTLFTPSDDSRICYVSVSGDDGTAQYYDDDNIAIGSDPFNPIGSINAYATIAAAFADTREGYPDWILLKRGDEFTTYINRQIRSGRDADEPFLIGSYGISGTSPILKTGANNGLDLGGVSASYWAVSSLDFYAHTRDFGSVDFINSNGGNNIDILLGTGDSMKGVLIEGCKFRFFVGGRIQLYNGTALEDITIRRCLITDNYSETMHSQGLYANLVDGITLEENIFIHNGWYIQSYDGSRAGGQATVFNHNTYFSGCRNVTFRENIFIRPSSANNKFTNPYAAETVHSIVIDNNLYIDGEAGIGMGANYPETLFRFKNITIQNNVLTDIGASRPTNRYLAWYFWFDGWDGGNVRNNLLLHQEDNTILNVVGFYIQGGHRNIAYTNNTVYGLFEGVGLKIVNSSGNNSSEMVFSNNKIGIPEFSDYTIEADLPTFGKWVFSDNIYNSNRLDGTWFQYDNFNVSLASWRTMSGDNSTIQALSFPDPTRSIEQYQASIGGSSTIDSFITACRSQSRFNWDARYSASRINNWFRTGFNMEFSSASDPKLISPQNIRIK